MEFWKWVNSFGSSTNLKCACISSCAIRYFYSPKSHQKCNFSCRTLHFPIFSQSYQCNQCAWNKWLRDASATFEWTSFVGTKLWLSQLLLLIGCCAATKNTFDHRLFPWVHHWTWHLMLYSMLVWTAMANSQWHLRCLFELYFECMLWINKHKEGNNSSEQLCDSEERDKWLTEFKLLIDNLKSLQTKSIYVSRIKGAWGTNHCSNHMWFQCTRIFLK